MLLHTSLAFYLGLKVILRPLTSNGIQDTNSYGFHLWRWASNDSLATPDAIEKISIKLIGNSVISICFLASLSGPDLGGESTKGNAKSVRLEGRQN